MINNDKVKEAVKLFLEAIGEDPNRDGLIDTPNRVARMCDELFFGIEKDASEPLNKTFLSGRPGLVIEKDIEFYSMCEHHLLPFYGKVHIAYMHGNRVVGLSKLARTVEVYSRRLQIQENMTSQIACEIMSRLNPEGVMVVVQAIHMCMSMRGVKKEEANTITVAAMGCFENDYSLQEYVLTTIGSK